LSDSTFEAVAALLRTIGAAGLTGVGVKLLDDALDEPEGGPPGRPAYAMLALALACLMQAGLAAGLFLASYAWGMVQHLADRHPTGLPGWAESLIALALGTAFLGWRLMAAAFLLVGCLQCLDALVDLPADRRRSGPSLALRFGAGETALAGAAMGLAAAALAPGLAAAVLGSGASLIWLTRPRPARPAERWGMGP